MSPRASRFTLQARASASGFTLLEILVVVLVIGIIVTFAVLSLGNRSLDDRLDNEAKRLQQLITVATEDAEVQGLDLGWRYVNEGYEFLALDRDGLWKPFPATQMLRPRALPEPLYLDLNVEGHALGPASSADKVVAPQVLILSSGEASAFRLDVRAHDYKPFLRIQGDALGRVTMRRFEDEP